MMRKILAFLALSLLPASAGSAPLDLPVRRDALAVPAPCYAGDVIELRLAPSAASAAHARGLGPTRPGAALRLGVSSVDAVSALLGGCEFEPEFVGETPPTDPNEPDFTAFWIVHLPPGAQLEDALDRFATAGGVVSALPVATLPLSAIPNDSLFTAQAWLYHPAIPRHDLHAPEAWDVEAGDTAIVVAILDTGVLPYHPDLGGNGQGQMWRNWAEAAGLPGVDDDGNGFVDDFAGWDFVDTTTTSAATGEDRLRADNDPNDFSGHGTAVAGIVGAITNNAIGIAGVAPVVRLMPLRIAWQVAGTNQLSADVSMLYAAQAIRYATRMGASVINASFSSLNTAGSGLDVAVTAATRAGVAIANASGNGFSSPAYLGQRDDVIAVAGTDSNDVVQSGSTRGPWVDVSAQSVDMLSTFVDRAAGTDSVLSYRVPGYRSGLVGTSFAAPQLAGTLALMQAQRRAQGRDPYTVQGLLARVRETADDVSAWNPVITGYGTGRLNAYRALSDPPTTSAVRTLAQAIGAPVVLRDNTGRTTVVYATTNQKLVAFDGMTADTAWTVDLPAMPAGGLTAADFAQGRGPLIFVGTTTGSVLACDENGVLGAADPWTAFWTRTGLGASVTGGVAIGDLDGDSSPEVVAVLQSGRVTAWGGLPGIRAGFPFDPGTPGTTAVALANLDNVPGDEVIFATGDGQVHALREDGADFGNWPYLSVAGTRAPVVAHFSGAGSPPVVLIASGVSVTALEADGSERWTQSFGNAVSGDLALGDFTGDGLDEIVVVTGATITVLDSNGVAVPSRSPGAVSSGPSNLVIGPLRAGHGACIGARLTTGFFVWDDSGHVAPAFPKPGIAGTFPSLADLDGDGATEVAAGTALADSMVYAFDAGAGTWNDALAYWPTPRGDDARTGARHYPVGLPLFDRIRPAPPSIVAEAVSATQVRVRWVNTGDDSLAGSALLALVLGSTPPGAFPAYTHSVMPAHASGAPDTVFVPVGEGQLWDFSIMMSDEAGNASVVATDTVLVPGGPPSTIADLRVAAAHDSTVKLLWTAPTDDGPAGRPVSYEIAGTTGTLDEAGFANAPLQRQLVATAVAGAPESLTVTGLERGRQWTFAVRGVDGTGSHGAMSNTASAMLRTGGAIDGRSGRAIAARPVPGVPPITLDWQGADGAIGTAQSLDLLDLGGRLLRRVQLGGEPGGSWMWDGRDANGRAVPAGLYFARLASGGGHSEARVVLLR